MKFTRLGNSGLSVSRLCLGCMTYGDTTKGWHGDWLLVWRFWRAWRFFIQTRNTLLGSIGFLSIRCRLPASRSSPCFVMFRGCFGLLEFGLRSC